jgi:hypothetical protein
MTRTRHMTASCHCLLIGRLSGWRDVKNSRSRSGGSSVGIQRSFLVWRVRRGKLLRNDLCSLSLICFHAGIDCTRLAKTARYAFTSRRDSKGLEKITRLVRPQCKYGTDCQLLTTLERNLSHPRRSLRRRPGAGRVDLWTSQCFVCRNPYGSDDTRCTLPVCASAMDTWFASSVVPSV